MFEKLRKKIEKTTSKFSDVLERERFIKCFFNTIDTTCKMQADGSVFVITGDIPAMWLRDSAAQVIQYLYFADDEDVQKLIKGVLKRQFQMILIDPYANSLCSTKRLKENASTVKNPRISSISIGKRMVIPKT